MKKLIIIATMFLSFYAKSQFSNVPVNVFLNPYYLNVQVWNPTMFNARCSGQITLVNMYTGFYSQFFYNQFIWARSSDYRSYYLGAFNNGFNSRVANYNIQCF